MTSGGTARCLMAKESADLCLVLFWSVVSSVISPLSFMLILFLCLGLLVKSYFTPQGPLKLIHTMTGKNNIEMLNSSLHYIKSFASSMLAINYRSRLFLALTSNNMGGARQVVLCWAGEDCYPRP